MGNSSWKPIVILSCVTLLFHSLSIFSEAVDTIKQGQSIKDGETITSSAGNFALGFFSPENSKNRYLGIWYNKVSVQTVVWVANRETPVLNSLGVLTIGNDGNLKLLDEKSAELWSTNTSMGLVNTTAILMDTGNFVLYGEEVDVMDKALWQSFEEPTDTFLPGMRAGLNTRNGETHLYSSWKSDSDPSQGNFTMGVDPNGLAQIVIWENSRRHWRSGLWNGQVFIGVPEMRVLYLYGFKLSDQDGQMYFTYTVLNSSDILRFRLRWDGTEEQLNWDEDRKQWSIFWAQPRHECQIYNKCGAFATCNMLSSPICTCLQGFEPKSKTEWSRGNWSSGCARTTELQCEKGINDIKGDGFLELDGIKLPDDSVFNTDYSKAQCEDDCLGSCSCKAYAHVSGIGCLTWSEDLVDLQQFQRGGNKLYIRLPKSELARKHTIPLWAIILSVILGIIFLSASAYFLSRWKANSEDLRRKIKKETMVLDGNRSREVWAEFSEQYDIQEDHEEHLPDLLLLSFEGIAMATNNFSDEFKLGEGGFGPVYKSKMPCGKELAIKRLSRKSCQGIEEFKNEVVLIAKLHHRNLVRLLGCCIHDEEKLLVYEYLPNKSLDTFIFDPTIQVQLDWGKRFNIIEGIARGLLYLHRDSRLRIIHRDLKASNILLDEEMNPKISDFGMARIYGGNENPENTNRVVGTYGYMAPEYAMEGLFSVKSDVYSFGILLLEILSGIKNTQFRDPEHHLNLLGYVWKLWTEERAMDFIDPCIKDSCNQNEVLRCIQIGLLCLQDSAMDRPTMPYVILFLGCEATVIPTPTQPTFTIGRKSRKMHLSIDTSETVSTNDMTETMITGR